MIEGALWRSGVYNIPCSCSSRLLFPLLDITRPSGLTAISTSRGCRRTSHLTNHPTLETSYLFE